MRGVCWIVTGHEDSTMWIAGTEEKGYEGFGSRGHDLESLRVAPSLLPRGRPSTAEAGRDEGMAESSCAREKKSSSPSYGEDPALIYESIVSI